jgi:pilus assembly protein CpaD
MQTVRTMIAGRGGRAALALRAATAVGLAALVCGCNTDRQISGVPDTPIDYRMRHPISIKEADRTVELFIGSNRGTLTPSQRADVVQFAHEWRHESTGGVVVNIPTGASNERAASEALTEIRSLLLATGVPPQGIAVRPYPASERKFATVRINYPKITASAGPCGLWPKDLGPSADREYFENQPYWNLGCSSQRNLAAMVDNPADLVQPRGETPVYTARRTTVLDKYRKGDSTATTYPDNGSSKISDVGK